MNRGTFCSVVLSFACVSFYLESDEDVKLVAEKDLALPFAKPHKALKENFH